MLAASIPVRFQIPFANSAAGPYIRDIPIASQIGVQDGAASFTTGFVPDNFTNIGAGGVPPFGQDFNGILLRITQWNQWQQAGGPIPFDNTFAVAIGGYPLGAMLAAADGSAPWQSTVDGNTTNPDTGGAGWNKLGLATTGFWDWSPGPAVARAGWVIGNGTTIGSAASVASQLADASAFPLYTYFWTNFPNSLCPVSGGRGVSALADFNANKTIGTYDMRGTGIMGMDTMGGSASTFLAGVPAVVGNATTAGSLLGENLHALTSGENGPHIHSITDPTHNHSYVTWSTNSAQGAGGITAAVTPTTGATTGNSSTGISINNSGSGTAHNTVQRSAIGTHYFKL